MKILLLFLLLLFHAQVLGNELAQVRLPDGFQIEVFAESVPNARSMTEGSDGTIYVGNRRGNSVYAVRDTDGDHVADDIRVIASGLVMPNGVAYRDGDLYVAEMAKVWRYSEVASEPRKKPVLVAELPDEAHHGWRYIDFGPDDRLYVAIGAPCNVCDKKGFANISSMTALGANQRIEAYGVRNSVGFTWHPTTEELWFTDNGRDHLGDDLPPGELNRLSKSGEHFGFPYCHGGELLDPDFGQGQSCSNYQPPAQKLGPHVAPLGVLFYSGTAFPDRYRGKAFIAEHGSWNRSKKIGYRITMVDIDGESSEDSYQVFADGWLQDEKVSGRPVDLLQRADGSLLVSDDLAGKIYRITYTKAQ